MRGRKPIRAHMITLPDVCDMGPKMLALSDSQQAFVLAYIANGGRSVDEAAFTAGYGSTIESAHVTASRLSRQPDVQDAIFEEMKKQGRIDLVSRYANVRQIADSSPKDEVRLKANLELLNLGGWGPTTRHEVVVEHKRSTKEILEALRAYSQEIGEESKPLLAGVIEGEFEEVAAEEKEFDGTEGLEDVL